MTVATARRYRVAFNALALQPQGTGVQTYVRELLRALALETDADLTAVVRRDAVDQLPGGIRATIRRPARGILGLLQGARALGPADLVHGLDVHVPARHRTATVVTIHDLSAYDVPWAFPRRRLAAVRAATSHAMRQADEVIAVSGFTADRIMSEFGRKAHVTPLAASPRFSPPDPESVGVVRRRYNLPPTFVLYVGAIEPRKDIDSLTRACEIASVPLVVAGRTRGSTFTNRRARVLGYVPDSDLPALYGAAAVMAYPSVYEGFGLPPLEAMACGTPVVAYRVPALIEVLSEAAMLTTPKNPENLAHAITTLLRDPARRDAQIQAGKGRAAALTWAASATATRRVYADLGVRV